MDKTTLKLPDAKPRDRIPFFSFGGREGTPSGAPFVPELRDVTQPVCFDANGQPVYAPRGLVIAVGAS